MTLHPEIAMPTHVTHELPVHSSDKPFVSVRTKATLRMVRWYLHTSSYILAGFFTLLSHCRIAKSGSTAGLTWLELMLLSMACSSTPLVDIKTHKAKSLKTMAQLLREFTTSALRFLKFFYPPHVVELFHASFVGKNRLQNYGIVHRFTHTSMFLDLPSSVAVALNDVILHTFHDLSCKQFTEVQLGQRQLKTRKSSGHH
eukprot:12421880-Karenia_brevis.AAC.1